MTDEEKKEYRDKLVEDCMKYNHIDYDDDKDIVETMVEAIASEELMELIPNFDPYDRCSCPVRWQPWRRGEVRFVVLGCGLPCDGRVRGRRGEPFL